MRMAFTSRSMVATISASAASCASLLPFGGGDELIVLCAQDDGVDTNRFAIVVVLYGHLTLGVGTQIGHLLAFLTDGCQFLQNEV